jgi:hypothetical protein
LIASPLLDSEVHNKPNSTKQIAKAALPLLTSAVDQRDERARGGSNNTAGPEASM